MEEELRPRLIPRDPVAEQARVLRGFGVGLGILFSLLAWRLQARGFAAAAVACLVVAGIRPQCFGVIFRLWMPVVGVLAWINLWVLCGILYYLVVTPYGLFLRMLGLSPLALRLREKNSYWENKPARDPAESARRIF